ncbi:MAG: BamA/TamA family outer membrane protein [Gemmatimonadetes bacterium]|nr:BamA/TamA family outer membrane protein [Gemmatimonadota bacterium]
MNRGGHAGCARPCPGRPSRPSGVLPAALLLALLPAGAAAQQPDSSRAEVLSLRFRGAAAFDHDLLRAAIATSAGHCANPLLVPLCWFGIGVQREQADDALLRADALRLRLYYYQRGYRQARVEVSSRREDGGSQVVFHVDEGHPVRVVAFEIVGQAPLPPEVTRRLPLEPGQPLDLLRYEAARDSILARLRNRGYPRAEVLASYFIPEGSPYEAQVRFDVIPGSLARFGAIEVIGAERVSSTVVRRLVAFQPGDLYSQEELLRSQRNLYGLDIFKHAEIRVALDAETDSVTPVTVQVNEGDVYRVRLGAGLSTSDCANAESRWTSRNFLGGARRLELRSQVSNVLAGPLGSFPCLQTGGGIYSKLTGSLAADFVQPWFFSPRSSLGAGLFLERRSVPGLFVRTARGGYLSATRTLSERTALTLAYRPELTELIAEGDRIFCVSFVVCETGDIEVLRDPHWLVPLILSLARDRSNSLFAPTRGYVLRLDAEHASAATGSDFAYNRVAADLSSYRGLGAGVVVASRLRPGWAWATGEPAQGRGLGLHPQRRFFAGGPNSVRGFAQYRLGPKVLTVDAARVLAQPDTAGGAGCTAQQINSGECDAQPLATRSPERFDVRPVGGAAVLEGSLELRFPLLGDRLRGATFLDFGQAWSETGSMNVKELVWTPGFGFRYFSPVGPIRVDLGYNSQGADRLAVLTTEVCARTEDGSGCDPIIPGRPYDPAMLRNTNRLLPLRELVAWNPRDSFLDRLQLHLSIGQAF